MAKLAPIDQKKDTLDFLFTIQGKDMNKVYTMCTENICRIFRDHNGFKDRIRYDAFKNRMEFRSSAVGEWRPMEDRDALDMQSEISIRFSYFQRVTKAMVFDAMIIVAYENQIDSAHDWLKSLKWDGEARLDSWLTHTYGVGEDEYYKTVGANWLKGLVKRIVFPGCKFDYVLVLEGSQGSKKSTSLNVLGGDWHIETTMGTESKDFFMQFQGKAIIEFSEGETLSRTEVKRMKAIITTQVDSFRPPYERSTRDFPRRCVFAMTTNQDEYLKDETGNRRWLPVKVQKAQADVEWLKDNRDQLFAEAYHRVVNLNESVWEFPDEETARHQMERRVQDPNTDLVVDWYHNLSSDAKAEGITIHQVYKDVYGMGFSSKPMTKFEEMAVAGILKDVLRLTKKREMVNGVRATRWYDGNINKSPYAINAQGELVKDDPLDF